MVIFMCGIISLSFPILIKELGHFLTCHLCTSLLKCPSNYQITACTKMFLFQLYKWVWGKELFYLLWAAKSMPRLL
jgi:hypothetical protein